ncbi:MAG: formyltransferase [Alphaproteobacteria bacterium]
MSIIVFAYSQIGHDCLKILLENKEDIRAVFTHEDNKEEHIWFDSVQKLAKAFNIPVHTPIYTNDEEIINLIRSLKPDLIFSFYYRKIINAEILKIPKLGAFNVHGSLLPYYRGCAPINWAIICGAKETGATLHYMEKEADVGDIVDQKKVSIDIKDNAGVVYKKINKAAQIILMRRINELKNGTAPRISQDHTKATYFKRRNPEDGLIDWTKSPIEIYNFVRALQPYPKYPSAFVHFDEERIIVNKIEYPANDVVYSYKKPGIIINKNDHFIEVSCGDGKQRLKIPSNNTL